MHYTNVYVSLNNIDLYSCRLDF